MSQTTRRARFPAGRSPADRLIDPGVGLLRIRTRPVRCASEDRWHTGLLQSHCEGVPSDLSKTGSPSGWKNRLSEWNPARQTQDAAALTTRSSGADQESHQQERAAAIHKPRCPAPRTPLQRGACDSWPAGPSGVSSTVKSPRLSDHHGRLQRRATAGDAGALRR